MSRLRPSGARAGRSLDPRLRWPRSPLRSSRVATCAALADRADGTEPNPCLGGMLRPVMADTNELARDRWRTYFDDLSRGLATMQATVEIDGPDLGAQVQAEGLVLSGISYDDRDDVLVIGLSPEGRPSRWSILSRVRSESASSPQATCCPRPSRLRMPRVSKRSCAFRQHRRYRPSRGSGRAEGGRETRISRPMAVVKTAPTKLGSSATSLRDPLTMARLVAGGRPAPAAGEALGEQLGLCLLELLVG